VTDDFHILVVDDDARLRALLSRYLAGEGYRVTTAEGAADARAKLRAINPDLIVLDVMMPGRADFRSPRRCGRRTVTKCRSCC